MVKDGAVQLGDIAGKITMLEIACRRCDRRGRLADAHETITDMRRRLDTATAQLGEALSQVRALTDQKPTAPRRRAWLRWRR